jgi:hypothetical protein
MPLARVAGKMSRLPPAARRAKRSDVLLSRSSGSAVHPTMAQPMTRQGLITPRRRLHSDRFCTWITARRVVV